MSGYTSKTRALYRNVFLAILFFTASVFAAIFFLMTPKVKIDFNLDAGSEFTKPSMSSSVYYDRGELLTKEVLDEYNKMIGIHERDGYIFEGWRHNGDLIDLDTKFLVDVQLFASWIPKQYSVKFDLNGGEYDINLAGGNNTGFDEDEIFLVRYTQEKDLPPIPSSDGFVKGKIEGEDLYTHNLVGWKVNKNEKIYSYPENRSYIVLLEDIDRYPGMEEIDPEDIEFDLDEGQELGFAERVEYFKDLTYGEVLLKAEWKHNEIEISVIGEGEIENEEGEIEPVQEFNYLTINHKMAESTTEDMFTNISRAGYEIDGFYDINGTPIDFESFAPYKDTEIFVKWKKGVYKVKFDALNGRGDGETLLGVSNIYPTQDFEVEIEYETYLIDNTELIEGLSETPQLNGYVFAGWYLVDYDIERSYDHQLHLFEGEPFDFEADYITSNSTLYAKWVEDKLIDTGEEYRHSQYYWYESYNHNGVDGHKITRFLEEGEPGYSDKYLSEPTLIVPSKHPVDNKPVFAIGGRLFEELHSLKTVKIASTIIDIHPQAFWDGLPLLEEIRVDTNNPAYDDDNGRGVLYNKDRTVLIKYPEGKDSAEYIVGEAGRSVREIYPYAFYNNKHIKSITLNVEKIGGGAFENTNLETVTITNALKHEGFGLYELDVVAYRNPFRNTSIENVIIDERSTDFAFEDGALYGGDFENGEAKYHNLIVYFNNSTRTELVVDSQTKHINDYAFENSNVQKITLPNNLVSLGIKVFANSSELSVVDFGSNSNASDINFGPTETHENRYVFEGVDLKNLTLVASNELFRAMLESARPHFNGDQSDGNKVTIAASL